MYPAFLFFFIMAINSVRGMVIVPEMTELGGFALGFPTGLLLAFAKSESQHNIF